LSVLQRFARLARITPFENLRPRPHVDDLGNLSVTLFDFVLPGDQ
jgi:hypothetical protein